MYCTTLIIILLQFTFVRLFVIDLSACLLDTDLRLSPVTATVPEAVDPNQSYDHAKSERPSSNSIQDKASDSFCLFNQQTRQLSPHDHT